jgi:hypothetical protein
MGAFLVVAQLFIFSAVLNDPKITVFLFWSCNNFCILLAIACFKKDMQMIKGISYLGLVSQILWILDFGSDTLGFDLSGVADYIYLEGFTYANEVSIGVHMIVPVSVLLFSVAAKPTYWSLLYALPYIVFLYIATILFTPPSEDINCVFLGCGNTTYLPYSIFLWPVYAVISTLIAYGVHLVLYYVWNKARVGLGH